MGTMPCTDGGPSCGYADHISLACHKEELAKLQDRLDYVTDMLCRVMQYATGTTAVKNKTLGKDLLELHPGLSKWWTDHQEKDSREREIKDAEEAVKKAMAKLKKLRGE